MRILQIAAVLAAAWAAGGCNARDASTTRVSYPATRIVNAADELHGVRVPDPYRWLEDLNSSEVREWAAAQTTFALPMLRDNDVRPWLLNRVDELSRFYNIPDEDTNEPALIENRALEPGQAIDEIWPSHDRKHAAYSI